MRVEIEGRVPVLQPNTIRKPVENKYHEGILKSTPRGESKVLKLTKWKIMNCTIALKRACKVIHMPRLETRTEEFDYFASRSMEHADAQ